MGILLWWPRRTLLFYIIYVVSSDHKVFFLRPELVVVEL